MSTAPTLPDLREFVKENDQKVYDFCCYMLAGLVPVDDFVISLFREFAQEYRRMGQKPLEKGMEWDMASLRVRLFEFTWEKIQSATESPVYSPSVGRDMRSLRELDEDLIPVSEGRGKTAAHQKESSILERLSRVDQEFRAPLVLRDVLSFTDEEAVQILGLRWAVYRHRLHRGRVDFKDALRGWPVVAGEKSSTVEASA